MINLKYNKSVKNNLIIYLIIFPLIIIIMLSMTQINQFLFIMIIALSLIYVFSDSEFGNDKKS